MVLLFCHTDRPPAWFDSIHLPSLVLGDVQEDIRRLADVEQPRFIRNASGRFESRFATVTVRSSPSIMLLDEPFAGIDPLSISDIRDLVKDLKQRGIGVLITDHNVRETLEIMMPGGGYCLAPTHQLQDNSPTENVIAMYETFREYGSYSG